MGMRKIDMEKRLIDSHNSVVDFPRKHKYYITFVFVVSEDLLGQRLFRFEFEFATKRSCK